MLESTKHTCYSLDTAADECLELSEEALNTLKVPGQPAQKYNTRRYMSSEKKNYASSNCLMG